MTNNDERDNDTIFRDAGRIHVMDQQVHADVESASLTMRMFTRVAAKERVFDGTHFRYSIFNNCYFRRCRFESCDFTGCKFVGSNLRGSTFSGCKFDYATFERTQVDPEILEASCPGWDNLRQLFARTLRTNFQSLGDAKSANRALQIELAATREMLSKSWRSTESYYRNKYTGLRRVEKFFDWAEFAAMDFVWGNGESLWKPVRCGLLLWLAMAILHWLYSTDADRTLVGAFPESLTVLAGLGGAVEAPPMIAAIFSLTRIALLSLVVSVFVKRFNRR